MDDELGGGAEACRVGRLEIGGILALGLCIECAGKLCHAQSHYRWILGMLCDGLISSQTIF